MIPTFNRCDYVSLAIASVLRQTFTDLEVVVSDNHSPDDTRAVVESFTDERVRYVQPPEHCIMPEHWEFVRQQARGEFVLLLGDDDALVSCAVEHFVAAAERHNAEFLFSGLAEYFDPNYGTDQANTLQVLPFDGSTSVVSRDELLGPLYGRLKQAYRMDPSAFVFTRELGDRVAARAGHFFHTQGAEYFAWPLAAAFATGMAHVSLPLLITGRTPKSWGTNMVLVNPGKEKISALVSDAGTDWRHSPVSNFTFANLMTEGMLTAQAACPEELGDYHVDQTAYLRAIYQELRGRQAKGVDVTADLEELERLAAADPSIGRLEDPFLVRARNWARYRARSLSPTKRRGGAAPALPRAGVTARGSDYGFSDILGAAELAGQAIGAPDRPLSPLQE